MLYFFIFLFPFLGLFSSTEVEQPWRAAKQGKRVEVEYMQYPIGKGASVREPYAQEGREKKLGVQGIRLFCLSDTMKREKRYQWTDIEYVLREGVCQGVPMKQEPCKSYMQRIQTLPVLSLPRERYYGDLGTLLRLKRLQSVLCLQEECQETSQAARSQKESSKERAQTQEVMTKEIRSMLQDGTKYVFFSEPEFVAMRIRTHYVQMVASSSEEQLRQKITQIVQDLIENQKVMSLDVSQIVCMQEDPDDEKSVSPEYKALLMLTPKVLAGVEDKGGQKVGSRMISAAGHFMDLAKNSPNIVF